MTITFTVPDAQGIKISDALGYRAQIYSDGVLVANPESRLAYVKRITAEFYKMRLADLEREQAAQAASLTDLNIT